MLKKRFHILHFGYYSLFYIIDFLFDVNVNNFIFFFYNNSKFLLYICFYCFNILFNVCFNSINICLHFINFRFYILSYFLKFLNSDICSFVLFFKEFLDCLNLSLPFRDFFGFKTEGCNDIVNTYSIACSIFICLIHFILHIESTSLIIYMWKLLIHHIFIWLRNKGNNKVQNHNQNS